MQRRQRRGKPWDRGGARLELELAAVEMRYLARGHCALSPDFRLDLPVVDQRPTLREAIAAHQVVVVCGETGSGKSTQLPKICVELGRGIDGVIAHTQPRRIAARNLAARVAEETGTALGDGVGYKIRFQDRAAANTRIKLVTDGMLLAETRGDPQLAEYDTIIVDEAHERSLNIDFLLGYLERLRRRRPELKVIITSATIDPQRFAAHFGGAPIIEVSGRTYPVAIRYRPLASDDEEQGDRTLQQGILEAVDELAASGPGDVLVFLPGEREIRATAESLRKHHPPQTEILPLFGRLSAAEQQRVFSPHARRRVVLATNVAETSLTVPGVRYVVDTGLVRLSRYSYRTKVQRLPIEPISRASADQRAGRCGRLGPGVCIRLYSESDYRQRPAHTDPEIRRTSLAAVILQMKSLGLGDVERFPFLDPPDPRHVGDGLKLLYELQALDAGDELTDTGRRLARLPVDPRIARMLLAAEEQRCLTEALVLAAALTIQDPRERPLEARSEADAAHARWRDKRSDFLSLLALWNAFHERRRRLSANKLRRWCREHFLSYPRMREWWEVQRQLRELAKGMGFRENTAAAAYQPLHRALFTGLLANVAVRAGEQGYTGPRNLQLQLHPGSGLAKRRPKWIVAAELVETTRVFARTAAEIRPEWVEAGAAHLVSRHRYEPFWEPGAGRVAGYEDVTLYGLPLVTRRKVDFSRVAPVQAREVFIREALLHGRLRSAAPCLQHNRELIAGLEAIEAKARRRDVLIDEAAIERFYAEHLPAHVVDAPSFEKWIRRRDHDARLRLTREYLTAEGAVTETANAFPDHLDVGGVRVPLGYHFQPGDCADGVTATVPIAALNQLPPETFEWLVPGLLEEKVTTLIRALPKRLRKNFVPAPDFAAAALAAASSGEGSLLETVRRELERMTGVRVPLDAWDNDNLPLHLQMRFRVVDDDGAELAAGRNLQSLQRTLAGTARQAFTQSTAGAFERSNLRDWSVGTLPGHVGFEQRGVALRGYPALVDEGAGVALRVLDAPATAERMHRAGVRALIRRVLGEQVRRLRRDLPDIQRLCLLYSGIGSCQALKDDVIAAAIDRAFLGEGVPRDEAAFRRALQSGRTQMAPAAEALTRSVKEILEQHRAVRRRLDAHAPPSMPRALDGLREQLDALVYPGFVVETPAERLGDLPRYLQAAARRLDRCERDPGRAERDRRLLAPWLERFGERRAEHREKAIDDPALEAFRWLLEEYRVSLFAQDLGTRGKISEKRLEEAWRQVP